jgi:hypothetical protein
LHEIFSQAPSRSFIGYIALTFSKVERKALRFSRYALDTAKCWWRGTDSQLVGEARLMAVGDMQTFSIDAGNTGEEKRPWPNMANVNDVESLSGRPHYQHG